MALSHPPVEALFDAPESERLERKSSIANPDDNRAALVSADHIVLPLSADLFAIKGLQNVGPTIREWRTLWQRARGFSPLLPFDLPLGGMSPIGYVVSRYSVRQRGPVKAFQRWLDRVPAIYRQSVLDEPFNDDLTIDADPRKLARLKDYRALMPLSQEARKPMFMLKPADGAIGGHQTAVTECFHDFSNLAKRILRDIGLMSEIEKDGSVAPPS